MTIQTGCPAIVSTALRVGRLDVQHTVRNVWAKLASAAPGGRSLAAEAIATFAAATWDLTPVQATAIGTFSAGIGLISERCKAKEADIVVSSRAGLKLPGRDKAALAVLVLGLPVFSSISFPELDRARKSTGWTNAHADDLMIRP